MTSSHEGVIAIAMHTHSCTHRKRVEISVLIPGMRTLISG